MERCLSGGWRFIPTCVGNSTNHSSGITSAPVHPHVCGELFNTSCHSNHSPGSSPRVWGTLVIPCCNLFPYRFIPTCVGNSLGYLQPRDGVTVHPHVCGELAGKEQIFVHRIGSSPRVWGTLLPYAPLVNFLRFIPTCVGNSVPKSMCPFPASVHPHVCGELGDRSIIPRSILGSSPRVWGTPQVTLIDAGEARFIPTCVGNSYSSRSPIRVISVHPHVCGELAIVSGFKSENLGSSPRVWGTQPERA